MFYNSVQKSKALVKVTHVCEGGALICLLFAEV